MSIPIFMLSLEFVTFDYYYTNSSFSKHVKMYLFLASIQEFFYFLQYYILYGKNNNCKEQHRELKWNKGRGFKLNPPGSRVLSVYTSIIV